MTDDRRAGYATENVTPLTDEDREDLRGLIALLEWIERLEDADGE